MLPKCEALINHIISKNYPQCQFEDIGKFASLLKLSYRPNIITITGTNGKGSTLFALAHFFAYNKISFIAHSSPHFNAFNERINDNGTAISDETLFLILQTIDHAAEALQIRLNYYQVGFLCALCHTESKKPKWLILEVGIGGRVDPANYFDADIAIITYVGLDHMEVLGNSIEQIAWDKAHIARTDKPIIIGEALPSNAYQYLRSINAHIIHAKKRQPQIISMLPPTSLNCALSAIEFIQKNASDYYHIPEDLFQLEIPGRCQHIQASPHIFVDVAHNPDAVSFMLNKLAPYIQNAACVFALFAAQTTKEIHTIYTLANKVVDRWLIADLHDIDPRFKNIQNTRILPTDSNIEYFGSFDDAYQKLFAKIKENDLVIVFGSFTLASKFIHKHQNVNLTNDNHSLSCQ